MPHQAIHNQCVAPYIFLPVVGGLLLHAIVLHRFLRTKRSGGMGQHRVYQKAMSESIAIHENGE